MFSKLPVEEILNTLEANCVFTAAAVTNSVTFVGILNTLKIDVERP
jgi:hypothetical protein